ncbi:DUF2306 domain-containing protein [Arthrobacter crystallopoietes]|uniref:DUF2306 domain-containing protein n=1 Tax=Crystallibacter crystallopoietes TaxID=37928 RepID=UPI003D1F1C3B
MHPEWPVLIAVHAVAAAYSILFGAFQLLRRTKGGAVHRVIGRIWVAGMYIVILTSFGIRTLNGGFTWLHALSVFTFFTVSIGLWAARTGRIPAHRSYLTGSYFGILGAFVGVVAVPDRRIPQMAVNDLPGLVVWVACILLTAGFAVAGTALLRPARKPAEPAAADVL